MKKKTLMAWAYKDAWQEDFQRDVGNPGVLGMPFLFTRKSDTRDCYDVVKVSVTIKETK